MPRLTELGDGLFRTRGRSDYEAHQRMTEEEVPILEKRSSSLMAHIARSTCLNGLLK
jgi:hypothetical protein